MLFHSDIKTKDLLNLRALALGVLLFLTSCQENRLQLVPVRGNVRLGDRLVTTGYVSFRGDASQGNSTLHIPIGTIQATGTYELHTNGQPGAPLGRYKVLVFIDANQQQGAVHPLRPQWLMHEKYTREETTDLRVDVVPNASSTAYDLQLE